MRDELTNGAKLLSDIGRSAALESCARALVRAYDKGEACGGSVDWSDVDAAYVLARGGLGLGDDDGPTVCPVCGSGDCIMADDGIEPPKFCPNAGHVY